MISKTLDYLFSLLCKESFVFSVDSHEQVKKFGHKSTKSNMLASERRVRIRDGDISSDIHQGDRHLRCHDGGPQNPVVVAAWQIMTLVLWQPFLHLEMMVSFNDAFPSVRWWSGSRTSCGLILWCQLTHPKGGFTVTKTSYHGSS